MKKREPVKKKDNLVFFPDLEKRLTEKGLESLHSKKYSEAINYLEEAKKLDPENDDILIGLVLAYFEAGAFEKARNLAKKMLMLGAGDYFQMVDLYLTILIQLHEYTEIVTTVEALLEEKEVPADKYQHFLTILGFSKRMADNDQSANKEDEAEDDISIKGESFREELNLFSLKDPNDQMLLVSELSDKNIRPYLQEINDYLQSDIGHPFFKTLLLNLLKDQEYDIEVTVNKFKQKNVLVPTELPEINAQPRMVQIVDLLKQRLENDDPILFENIKSLVERHFLITYPFKLEPMDNNAWAAGFHFIALQYYGNEPIKEEFACEYDVSIEELEAATSFIKELEEISYPII